MNIEVSKLFHHPLNQEIYSLSEIDDLSLSIDDVGLLQPLVINQHNQVISGNRRFVAIQRLGWDKVDVSQVNINEEDTGKYLVHYNKFRQKTFREILNEYNVLLDHYNRELGRPKKGVLQNTIKGKSRDLISDELNIASSQIGKLLVIQKEDDSLITLIDEGVLTIGQAYIQISRMRKEREIRSHKEITILSTNNHRFHHKSSSDMFELEDGEVQLVFTSPPYWNKRKYSNEEGWLGNENTPEEYINNIINHFNDTHRVLNDKGSFFLNIGDTFKDGNLQNIPHRVVIGLQERGWLLRNTIIWSKNNPKPSSSKTNLTPSYEFIFHLTKSMKYYYEHTLTKLKTENHKYSYIGDRNIDIRLKTNTFLKRDGKNMGDFWDDEIVKTSVGNQNTNVKHPAMFPDEIVILPILQTTKPNDLVLDTFHGSGTTGRVSNQYGRRYVGYDLKVY